MRAVPLVAATVAMGLVLSGGASAAQELPRPWISDFKAWPQDKRVAYINGVFDGARVLGYQWVCFQGTSVDRITGAMVKYAENLPQAPILLAFIAASGDLGCEPEKLPKGSAPAIKRVPPK